MPPDAPTFRPNVDLNVVRIDATESSVHLCLDDARPDAVALFAGVSPDQHETLAKEIWTIGARVLGSAHAQAREASLETVGRNMLDNVERHVRTQFEAQEKTLTAALQRFFDPNDGEINRRLDAFVADEGVLGRFLEKHVGTEHSVLATTLARAVGEDSKLLAKLDPDAREGLVHTLETRLSETMAHSQRQLFQALDPMAEDGAVAKLLRSLRTEFASTDKDRAALLDKAVAALDANDEASAISRLMRETSAAKETLLQSLNTQDPQSPLGAIRRGIQEMLDKHGQTQRLFFEEHQKRYQELASVVQEAVVRKQSDAKSPRGGITFEDAVIRFTREVTRGGLYLVEATGNSTGRLGRSKVGDAVVSFTEDSAYAGCRVVLEAKQDASYTLSKALEEAKVARDNRGADVAVFVFAASHAPNGLDDFARHGNTIVVAWDPEDGSTDPILRGALIAALAMARRETTGDEANIAALADVEKIITSELTRLAKMRAATERIVRGTDTLRDELRIAEKQFDKLLVKSKATLRALNVRVSDEDEELATPVTLARLGGNADPQNAQI